MDFDLSEEQQMLKANVRNLLDKEIEPVVNEHEQKGPLTKVETVGLIRKLLPFGFVSGFLPEKYGGSQLEAKTNGILSRNWEGYGAASRERYSSLQGFCGY